MVIEQYVGTAIQSRKLNNVLRR